MNNLETLSGVMNALHKIGFKDDFIAKEDHMFALYAKKKYDVEDLTIVKTFRFEGMTNPSDQSTLFAIVCNDGLKGTLTLMNNSQSNQNEDLVRQIKSSDIELHI